MYLKRQRAPKNWPITRKGTKYIIRGNSNLRNGVPLLILLRDSLGIVGSRKELKKAMNQKNILLNKKIINEDKIGVSLFDVVSLVSSGKNYIVNLSEKGIFCLEEISEKESNSKIAKVIGKKMLKGKKLQLNLSDGINFISDMSCKVNDSVEVNFKENKIAKCVPLKEKTEALVFAGKHSGKKGVIESINNVEKMVQLKLKDETIHALIKQIMVLK